MARRISTKTNEYIAMKLLEFQTAAVEALKAENVALQKELDELKEQYRWHKIADEGLPEQGGYYQIYAHLPDYYYPHLFPAEYIPDYKEGKPCWQLWEDTDAIFLTDNALKAVTHWRKTPDDEPEQGE